MEFVKDSVFHQKFDTESEIIDIKKYFDDFAQLIPSVEKCQEEKCKNINEGQGCEKENCKNDEFFRNALGITQEQLSELKKVTSIDELKCDEEKDFYQNDIELPKKGMALNYLESNQLISVKKRKEREEISKTKFHRTYYKYCNYEWCIGNEKEIKTKFNFDNISFPAIVACIKIYHPFLSVKSKLFKIKLLQEIHILGDQTLAQLKDKIVCSLDYVGDEDVSKDYFLVKDDLQGIVSTKDYYPSSFFFIENIFYNDTRHPNSKDLSKVIREWAAKSGIGTFECTKMESTKICDLNLKLGRPYVYQHQGNCEHIIMFSDIRFIESNDPRQRNSFPKTHCTGRIYGKRCMMCTDFYARWLVIGNERLTHDKAYLCDNCFESYNYIDGKKIGNFEAFKYVDTVAVL